jgi:hypothetical protein
MLWCTIEFPNATISTPDFQMGYTVESANNAISNLYSYAREVGQWTDRQIEQDEVGMWIEHINESCSRSTHFCLLVKGHLTPGATFLLRDFFREKNAIYHKRAGVYLFVEIDSRCCCIRMLGVDHPRLREMDPVV